MCKAGVTKEQGDGFVTHMEGNSVSPSRHLTHLSLRRATPTKPHRSKDAFWTESAPRTVSAVGPTTVYNILGYCTETNLWTNRSQELGDTERCVALCMSVGPAGETSLTHSSCTVLITRSYRSHEGSELRCDRTARKGGSLAGPQLLKRLHAL